MSSKSQASLNHIWFPGKRKGPKRIWQVLSSVTAHITKACRCDKVLISCSTGLQNLQRLCSRLDSSRGTMEARASCALCSHTAGQPCCSTQHLDAGCLSQHNYMHSSGYIMKEKSGENHHLSLQITSNCVPFSPTAAFLKVCFLRAVGPAKLITIILPDYLRFSLEGLFK